MFHFLFHFFTPEKVNPVFYESILATEEDPQNVQQFNFEDFSSTVFMQWKDLIIEPQFYKVKFVIL